MSVMSAKIIERGNGLPNVGDYVTGSADDEIYEVVSMSGIIHTGSPGEGNYVWGKVILADWDDVDLDHEPTCTAIILVDDTDPDEYTDSED
jgi:hypothetical protein